MAKKVTAKKRTSVKKTVSKKRSDFATAKEFQTWRNRSRAAKKVWRERKTTVLRTKIEQANAPIRGLKRKLKIPPIPEGLTVEELKWRLIEAETRLAMEILTRGFVDTYEIEMLRQNMAIAVMPSRLRHLGTVTDEMEKMLKRAARKGKRALRKQAKEYAEYFDVPLREVYTLFFSP